MKNKWGVGRENVKGKKFTMKWLRKILNSLVPSNQLPVDQQLVSVEAKGAFLVQYFCTVFESYNKVQNGAKILRKKFNSSLIFLYRINLQWRVFILNRTTENLVSIFELPLIRIAKMTYLNLIISLHSNVDFLMPCTGFDLGAILFPNLLKSNFIET